MAAIDQRAGDGDRRRGAEGTAGLKDHVLHGVRVIPENHTEIHGRVNDVDVPQHDVRNDGDGADPTVADLGRRWMGM